MGLKGLKDLSRLFEARRNLYKFTDDNFLFKELLLLHIFSFVSLKKVSDIFFMELTYFA